MEGLLFRGHPEVPVEVREWIGPALASPDLVSNDLIFPRSVAEWGHPPQHESPVRRKPTRESKRTQTRAAACRCAREGDWAAPDTTYEARSQMKGSRPAASQPPQSEPFATEDRSKTPSAALFENIQELASRFKEARLPKQLLN